MTSKMCLVLLWLSVVGVAGVTVNGNQEAVVSANGVDVGSEQPEVPHTNGISASRLCSAKPVYTEAQCHFIGCCTWQAGRCVGDENAECPTFQIFQTIASGVDICERGWSKNECDWMGCCTFSAGTCKSAVGISACLANIPRNLLAGVPDICEGEGNATTTSTTRPRGPQSPLAKAPSTTPAPSNTTTPRMTVWEQLFGHTTRAPSNVTNLSMKDVFAPIGNATRPLLSPLMSDIFAPEENTTTDVPLLLPLVPESNSTTPCVKSTSVKPCVKKTTMTTTPEVPLFRRPEIPPVAPCPPGGVEPPLKPADFKPAEKPKGDAKPAEKPKGDAKPDEKPKGDAKPDEKFKPGEVHMAQCKPGNKVLPFSGAK